MPTLLEALEEKYGFRSSNILDDSNQQLVSIFVPKRPPRISVPQVLVLNNLNIDKAGAPEDLEKKCNSVKELDLAQNKLENWDEVFGILLHMPRVEFVNLSLNRLEEPIIQPPPCRMDTLRSLVLNNTKLDWYSVDKLLNLLPSLEELHLSLNEYTHVLLDTLIQNDNESEIDTEIDHDLNKCDDSGNDSEGSAQEAESEPESNNNNCDSNENCSCNFSQSTKYIGGFHNGGCRKTNAHKGVKKLHLNSNPITDWSEICRLGRLFPNLETLVLAECPLRSLLPVPSSENTGDAADENKATNDNTDQQSHEHFKNLVLLNLSSANIQSWSDIDRLSQFPALKNLRVQNWPLWEKCDSTEHERRQLLIARLPSVSVLNGGGTIGAEEREDSERAFIRYYMDKPEADRPAARYEELLKKHGKLDPLVNIDLRPEKKVFIKFTCGKVSEDRYVDVYRTVTDLKHRLEKVFHIPPCKMRLFYVDQAYRELTCPEEMRYPHKQLYSYNIATGDEIIIEQKK